MTWNFPIHILRKMGCGKKWQKWVKECIATVFINGPVSKVFKTKRGLRQGDLLSPFLFNVVAEGLNVLVQRVRELNLTRGIKNSHVLPSSMWS